jgi:hypothetical protein
MIKITREFENLVVDFIDLSLVYPNVFFVLPHGEEVRPIIMGTQRKTRSCCDQDFVC